MNPLNSSSSSSFPTTYIPFDLEDPSHRKIITMVDEYFRDVMGRADWSSVSQSFAEENRGYTFSPDDLCKAHFKYFLNPRSTFQVEADLQRASNLQSSSESREDWTLSDKDFVRLAEQASLKVQKNRAALNDFWIHICHDLQVESGGKVVLSASECCDLFRNQMHCNQVDEVKGDVNRAIMYKICRLYKEMKIYSPKQIWSLLFINNLWTYSSSAIDSFMNENLQVVPEDEWNQFYTECRDMETGARDAFLFNLISKLEKEPGATSETLANTLSPSQEDESITSELWCELDTLLQENKSDAQTQTDPMFLPLYHSMVSEPDEAIIKKIMPYYVRGENLDVFRMQNDIFLQRGQTYDVSELSRLFCGFTAPESVGSSSQSDSQEGICKLIGELQFYSARPQSMLEDLDDRSYSSSDSFTIATFNPSGLSPNPYGTKEPIFPATDKKWDFKEKLTLLQDVLSENGRRLLPYKMDWEDVAARCNEVGQTSVFNRRWCRETTNKYFKPESISRVCNEDKVAVMHLGVLYREKGKKYPWTQMSKDILDRRGRTYLPEALRSSFNYKEARKMNLPEPKTLNQKALNQSLRDDWIDSLVFKK